MTKPAPILPGAAAALFIVLASSPAIAQAQDPHAGMDMSTTAAAPAVNAATYLQMAASGDQFEIQSSQLALQMSQDATLRSFAQMLINDHTRLSADLANAAGAAGLAAPAPTLSAKHSQMLDALRVAGANFDNTYRQQQVLAHAEAAGLHRSYSTSGEVAGLRTAAGAALPMVERHLQQAQTMAPGASPAPTSPQTAPQPPSSAAPTGTTPETEPTPEQRAGERG